MVVDLPAAASWKSHIVLGCVLALPKPLSLPQSLTQRGLCVSKATLVLFEGNLGKSREPHPDPGAPLYRHIIEFPGEMPSLAFSWGGGGGRLLRQLSWLALLGSPYKTLSGLYFVPCGEAENPGGLFSGDRQGPSPRGSVGAVGPVWVGTPPADTLSGPAAHCLCLLSGGATTLTLLQAQNKGIRVSRRPPGSISACGPHWIFGGGRGWLPGRRQPVCLDSPR